MNFWRFKQVISDGLMLDCDLDAIGREGWELRAVTYLGKKVKGGLGSEQGISPEQSSTYIYHFQKEIGRHVFQGDEKKEGAKCSDCNLELYYAIHIGL